MADSRPIGVFDSGIGGLTVVSEIIKALPGEEIIYFGDTARVPYGSKSADTVNKFSCEIASFLESFNVKAIVIACNTVSSNSYTVLSESFSIPFIEVVTPGVKACLGATKNKKVGVIGTPATIKSGAYEKKLKEVDCNITVYSKACPLFVPLAEEKLIAGEITSLAVEMYLSELKETEIDSLILGCTHYPLLKGAIKDFLGDRVDIINPAKLTAASLKEFLSERNLLNDSANSPEPKFYFSDLNLSLFEEMSLLTMGKVYGACAVSIGG